MMIVGTRVQVPAYTDAWMRGDRYGVVVKLVEKLAYVQLDKSSKTLKFSVNDLQSLID